MVAVASCACNCSIAVPTSESARDMAASIAMCARRSARRSALRACESTHDAECRVLHCESLSSAVRSVVRRLSAAM